MLNCSELDVALEDTRVVLVEESWGAVVAGLVLLLLGGLLVVAGERLVRPLGAVVAAVSAAVVLFAVSALFFDGEFTCEIRLGISATSALLAAVIASCVLKTGVFALGAAGLGALVHLVYESLPVNVAADDDFVLLGRSGFYYVAMLFAVVLGGVVAYAQRSIFLRLTSSLLGGGCFALATYWVAERHGTRLPTLPLLAIVATSTAVGVATQTVLRHRRRSTSTTPREPRRAY